MPGFESPVDKTNAIVTGNPALAQDPQAVNALANVQEADGPTIAQGSKAVGFFGHLGNALGDIGKDAKGLYEGAGEGAEAVVKGTYHLVTQAANNLTEGVTLGHVGPYGFNEQENTADFNAGAGNIAHDVAHPLSTVTRMWQMMAHYGAFMDSMAHKHGIAYAAGFAIPQFAGAVMTDGALTGANLAGDSTVDIDTIAALSQKADNGEALSLEESNRLASAQARIARANGTAGDAGAAAQALEKTRNMFKGAVVAAEKTHVGQGLGLALRGLGNVAKFSGNYRLNATMYLTEMAANSNPELKALWEKTADAKVYDKYGRVTGTLGQSLADSVGLAHDALARSLVSGTIDAYTKYLGADPIGMAGNLVHEARSAEGMGGILGKWWKGLGIESGSDVYRNWDNSTQSVRAYQYMADHSATEIGRAFPGMYPDSVRVALGDAKDINGVLDVHAGLADSALMTRRIAPTMGAIKGLRLYLRSGLTVGNVLTGDVRGVMASAGEIKDLTGLDVRPTTVTEAAGSAQLRLGTSLSRRAALRITNLLTEVPRYIMETPEGDLKIEGKTFYAGDHNAIPGIGDQLRKTARVSALDAHLVEDMLEHTTSPTDMMNAVYNTQGRVVLDAIAKAAPTANQQMLRDAVGSTVNQKLYGMMAFDAEGGTGSYVQGRFGGMADLIGHPDGEAFGEGKFGLGQTHRGRFRFIDFRAVRNMIDAGREAIVKNQNLFAGHFAKLQELGDKDLQQAIEYTDAKLQGVSGRIKTAMREGIPAMDAADRTTGSAYRETHEQLGRMLNSVTSDKTLSETEKFFKMTKDVIWKGIELEKRIAMNSEGTAAEEWSAGTRRTGMMFDQGSLEAVRDYEQELFRKFYKPGQTVREIRDWALEQAKTVTGVEKERRLMANELFEKAMNSKLYDKHGFLNESNVMVDFLNRGLSKWFVPMALSTGGFVFRITTSEALLNVFRIGVHDFAASRLTASIAKNIYKATDLEEAGGIDEVVKGVEKEFRIANEPVHTPPLEEGDIPNEEGLTARAGGPFDKGAMERALESELTPEQAAELNEQMTRRAHNIREGMTEAGLIRRTVTNTVSNLYNAVEGVPGHIVEGMTKKGIAAGRLAAHDLFSGTLTGIERGILKGMNEDQMYRLLDDTTNYVMRHGGHIPDMGHGKSTSLFDPDVHSREIDKAMGIHKGPKGVKVVERNVQRGENYDTALPEFRASAIVENNHRIFQDPLLHPSARDLQREVEIHGERGFQTKAQEEALVNKLTLLQYDRLTRMDPAELEGMKRAQWMMKNREVSTGISPLMDYAKAIALNTVGSFAGYKGVAGAEKMFLQKTLIDQAVSGNIENETETAYRLAAMGDAAPKNIIAREFDSYGLFKGPAKQLWSSNFAQEINRLGIDKVMGPIMSWVSREPVSVWEYHTAMEELRGNPLMSDLERESIADNTALRRLSRFVHNPADRMQFEANTRLYAPFYFAQNQALRRATRVATEDFGAFDRYLRASLGVTHYVSSHTIKGAESVLSFPASQYIIGFFTKSAINTLGLFTNVNPTERSILSKLGIGLDADASSVQTIAPSGSQEGWGMFGNVFRPSSGPFVDIPLKGIHYFLDASWYNRLMLDTLGPIGSTSGITTDLIPSAADRAAIATIGDVAGVGLSNQHWNDTTSVVASVQVKAMHSALDNLMSKYILEYVNGKYASTHAFLADKSIGMTAQDQFITDARIYADRKMTAFLKPGSASLQQFIEDTHVAALSMYWAKALVGFAGPASVTLNATFTKDAEYQKIATTRAPDGELPSLSQAMTTFAEEYPANFLDLVSTSQTPKGSLPEDSSFVKWANLAPNVVRAIPSLLAYTVNRNSAYEPTAFGVQYTMGLRTADTPQQYIDAVNTALGNDYVYNKIEPQVYYESGSQYFGPNNPKNNLNENGNKDLDTAVKFYGDHFNPTWYANSPYGTGNIKKVNAITDLNKFTAVLPNGKLTPEAASLQREVISKGLMSKQTVENLTYLAAQYKDAITAYQNAITAHESGSTEKENLWNFFAGTLAKDPKFKNEQYLITSVLADAPSAN